MPTKHSWLGLFYEENIRHGNGWIVDDNECGIGFCTRALVLEVINNASKSIDLIGYGFQSQDIVQALVDAQKRGVEVRCVVDHKRNQNKTSKSIIEYARKNNIQVRLNKHYHIQHDKTMIIDGSIVETGSFNFTRSAEFENSENVLIIRDEPAVIAAYQSHFTSRWNLGK